MGGNILVDVKNKEPVILRVRGGNYSGRGKVFYFFHKMVTYTVFGTRLRFVNSQQVFILVTAMTVDLIFLVASL